MKAQFIGDVSVMPILSLSYSYLRSIELCALWNNPPKTHKTLQSSTLLYSVINLVFMEGSLATCREGERLQVLELRINLRC